MKLKRLIFFDKRIFFKDLLLIFAGSAIAASAYPLFLIPLKIVPGGVSGFSIILHHLINVPVGITSFVLNIPVLALGFYLIGRSFGVRTIIGMVTTNLFIDLFTYVVPLGQGTEDRLIGAIFGGLLIGIGLGIVFSGHASTGGTDVLGQIINRYTNFSTGVGIMIVDMFIISLAGLVFKNFEYALLGYLTLFISSKTIDFFLEGWDYARGVYIVSEKSDVIRQLIDSRLKRGVTILYGRGGYLGTEKEIIFTVVLKKQIPRLKMYVKEIDPNAFLIITNVYEIIGQGFKGRGVLKF